MVLRQPAGLSKEACLYEDADWLSSSVSQREMDIRLLSTTLSPRTKRSLGLSHMNPGYMYTVVHLPSHSTYTYTVACLPSHGTYTVARLLFSTLRCCRLVSTKFIRMSCTTSKNSFCKIQLCRRVSVTSSPLKIWFSSAGRNRGLWFQGIIYTWFIGFFLDLSRLKQLNATSALEAQTVDYGAK